MKKTIKMTNNSTLILKNDVMIDEGIDSEYADRRFRLSINAFTVVFDALGSNTVSTEWLTKLELLDNLFPWINYKIFSIKK